MTTLQSIHIIRPIYFLPDDNLAQEVLIPYLCNAMSFDCMVGYFSSRSFVQLAPGLASFLKDPQRTLRLIISPFITEGDREAIERGLKPTDEVIEGALADLLISQDGIVRHTLRCLSYLITEKRLVIKIALMRHAQFHSKAWIISDGSDLVAVHGSGNFTESGLMRNFEQITVSRAWIDPNQREIAGALRRKFDSFWDGREKICRMFDLPEAMEKRILKAYPVEKPPTEEEYLELVETAGGFESAGTWGYAGEPAQQGDRLEIPATLQYREGDYAHQGRAVDAWCGNGYRGILEMATGSGKTLTAMIAAKHLHEVSRRLLIVIAAPYLPLIDQWCEEVQPFGVRPVNLTEAANSAARRQLVSKVHRRLRQGHSDVEVLVATHETLCEPAFIDAIGAGDAPRLLIADEMHNLGRENFVTNPPEIFEHRLGLSATPVRQYDPEGTELLTEFFGKVVFRYTLEEAIGTCLVPYDYFVHCVYLTDDETARWLELTEKIKRLSSWRNDEERSAYLEKLFRDRRLILEAAENKVAALEKLLSRGLISGIHHTLIYATDKDPNQLREVNNILRDRGALFHQLTADETRNKRLMRSILQTFRSGEIKILTAKRVLDEGVNVPEIETAYILASTTVERQWVQRRGRVLRKCRDTNKEFATIHDFLVLPPTLNDLSDIDARSLIKQELRRVMEFAGIARNAGKLDGAATTIDKVVRDYFGSGATGV